MRPRTPQVTLLQLNEMAVQRNATVPLNSLKSNSNFYAYPAKYGQTGVCQKCLQFYVTEKD